MRFGYYVTEKTDHGYSRTRLLCGDCAAKRGLAEGAFMEPPDQHSDCADCGVSEDLSPIWSAEA